MLDKEATLADKERNVLGVLLSHPNCTVWMLNILAHVNNAPAYILRLRAKGLAINSQKVKDKNEFGRPISIVQYSLDAKSIPYAKQLMSNKKKPL